MTKEDRGDKPQNQVQPLSQPKNLLLENQRRQRHELEQFLAEIENDIGKIQKLEQDWAAQEELGRLQDKAYILRYQLRAIQVQEENYARELRRAEVLVLKQKLTLEQRTKFWVKTTEVWELLTTLIVLLLPEECIAELGALAQRLTLRRYPLWAIRYIILWSVLEMVWALYVQIRVENIWLPKK